MNLAALIASLSEQTELLADDIVLPWPDKVLSPNSRTHWAVRSKAVKKAREGAFYATLDAGWKPIQQTGKIGLHWYFYVPSLRRYDDDNLEASCKAYRDGIADALKIDDNRFIVTKSIVSENPKKPGRVVARIHGLAN